MALKDFMARGDQENGVAGAPTPQRVERREPLATVIDSSTELSGKLRCQQALRVDGRVKGELKCDEAVIVGTNAKIEASIEADSVIIGGEVKGDIAARRKITLERTARVVGDLATPGIVIEEGAKLEGRIVIGSDEPTKKPAQAASRPTAKAASPKASAPPPSA